MEVVDGQQRLTTLHLILTCLKPIASLLTKTFFHLTFETRDGDDRPPLNQIDFARERETVDYYHICQAYREIEQWCTLHAEDDQLLLLQHLLRGDGRNVRVIWFELGEHDKAVEAFTHLNVGKIALTNDELIRALFLGHGSKARLEDEPVKTQIAYEWDLIEKALHAADFWAFLTKLKLEHNRIGFLFELLADRLVNEEKDEQYKVFYSFNRKLAEPDVTLKSEWMRIKREFMRLQEWFEDERRVTFHIVGFLVTRNVELGEIRKLAGNCTKSDFDRKLRDRVYQCVLGPAKVPAKEKLAADLKAYLDGLRHPAHREKIRAVLLLFNLATLLENPGSNVRFQFDAYKDIKSGWDIEHIRSRATDKIPDRSRWLDECLSVLESQIDAVDADRGETQTTPVAPSVPKTKTAVAILVDKISNYRVPSAVPKSDEEFEQLRDDVLEHFGEDDAEERNDLGNLTLLDGGTNRGYGNSTFGVKREIILSLDKAGTFVPLCTRNVFLKAYSKKTGKPIFWTEPDGDDYQNTILSTLTGFFIGPEEKSK